ncbi:unnamed protein product [Arabidopsis lyrata]|uniref:Uncharacterized protein n=1 Tax=Arabidopsis lyrata subsp. lyrata TaxID=81972 RepID=D7MU41_ARALL|nr:uncharacterized protein LOC9299567 isoform X2 [Arabidopsis lyrata subsp. lyrata]EFH39750.1 hypothetical protein ARALYDRAFT_330871 [Arabidopsis lyrata subsp. lyrata]CAH8278225.1 unnamed protein product [Arabidopsis lyrata]|eukprot:XP_002863491.1 uncharacterized protein LOC9299567 isoform X2 [Arabidopsis lyrata subsp. lyrata]
MDLGGLISGLVSSSVYLMTRPFFFCISACVFCLRTALVTTFVSTDMVTSAIWFNLSMLWRAVWGSIWGSVLLFTFPIRFFVSIPRERLLEQSIYELRYEVESLERNRKEIEENLRAAIKEYRIMERDLDELEDEHDEAISKIEKLEAELQELKEENLQLKEVNGKDYWSKKDKVITSEEPSEIRSIPKPKNIPCESKGNAEFTSVKSPLYPFAKSTIPKDEEVTPRVLDLERKIAVSRSVFSAMLALVVGIVMYEAKEQELCTPLLGALFTVVGISLRSVVQFFSTVKNKPALDAVALMSLNWFIVGTLTYPTLPRVARIVVPRVVSTVGSVFALLHGGSVPASLELVNYAS